MQTQIRGVVPQNPVLHYKISMTLVLLENVSTPEMSYFLWVSLIVKTNTTTNSTCAYAYTAVCTSVLVYMVPLIYMSTSTNISVNLCKEIYTLTTVYD